MLFHRIEELSRMFGIPLGVKCGELLKVYLQSKLYHLRHFFRMPQNLIRSETRGLTLDCLKSTAEHF
jgi:hypothetical protein